MKETTRWMIVVALACFLFAPRSYALFDAAALLPVLDHIYNAIGGKLTGSLQRGFQVTTGKLMGNQNTLFNKNLVYKQMPASFCNTQVQAPTMAAKEARVSAYNSAVSYYSQMNGTGSGIDAPAHPNRFVLKFNQQVDQAAKSTSSKSPCSVLVPAPVDASGTNITCSSKQTQINTDLLAGVNPQPQLPAQQSKTAIGAQYESQLHSNQARQALAKMALSDAVSSQTQAMISAYRRLLSQPTIEELNKMSASGGTARDQLVLSQLRSKLLLQIYVEMLEQKRLLAAILSSDVENAQFGRLSRLRRAALQ